MPDHQANQHYPPSLRQKAHPQKLDISQRFLKSGANVIIWDNDSKTLEKATKDLDNKNLSASVVDVSNYMEVDKNVKEIKK